MGGVGEAGFDGDSAAATTTAVDVLAVDCAPPIIIYSPEH
jgi:hypothetical protein